MEVGRLPIFVKDQSISYKKRLPRFTDPLYESSSTRYPEGEGVKKIRGNSKDRLIA